jgi:hypothetical protein
MTPRSCWSRAGTSIPGTAQVYIFASPDPQTAPPIFAETTALAKRVEGAYIADPCG